MPTAERIVVTVALSAIGVVVLAVAFSGAPGVALGILLLCAATAALAVAYDWAKARLGDWLGGAFGWGGPRTRDIATELGLDAKGTDALRGTWKDRRVVVDLAQPAVVIGDPAGAKGGAMWTVVERDEDEAIDFGKHAPPPAKTGDRAFDERFVWRPEPGQPATLVAPVRRTLLSRREGCPDFVEAWETGLSYEFLDQQPVPARGPSSALLAGFLGRGPSPDMVPAIKEALDGAVALADALGLPRA